MSSGSISGTMPGGISQYKPADKAIQDICDKVKGEVESRTGKSYSMFKAIEYASQVVAGMNYYIKVDVGGSSINITVYQSLPYEGSKLEVTGVDVD